MLNRSPATTILPTHDLDSARRFYGETLGLKEVGEDPIENGVIFEAGGGSRLEVQQRDAFEPAAHTTLTFEVEDLESEVDDLESRGVHFEDYDGEDLKTDAHHIAHMNGAKAAWFKDPDGNVLCVHQG
jgi:catechol 2,3-dioxygenase-like lactoylglutathione lyase family enzyme